MSDDIESEFIHARLACLLRWWVLAMPVIVTKNPCSPTTSCEHSHSALKSHNSLYRQADTGLLSSTFAVVDACNRQHLLTSKILDKMIAKSCRTVRCGRYTVSVSLRAGNNVIKETSKILHSNEHLDLHKFAPTCYNLEISFPSSHCKSEVF